jgi:hypothetical protein
MLHSPCEPHPLPSAVTEQAARAVTAAAWRQGLPQWNSTAELSATTYVVALAHARKLLGIERDSCIGAPSKSSSCSDKIWRESLAAHNSTACRHPLALRQFRCGNTQLAHVLSRSAAEQGAFAVCSGAPWPQTGACTGFGGREGARPVACRVIGLCQPHAAVRTARPAPGRTA